MFLLSSFVSRSVSPFARLISRQVSGIYPWQSWYSMPDDDDYSHLGKSLFRSRHYRVTVLRYLDEVSRGPSDRNESSSSSPDRFRGSREGLSVLLFSSPRALFRPQSTRDIADSKAFPQTTFSLLVFAYFDVDLRVDIDDSRRRRSVLITFIPRLFLALANAFSQILLDIARKRRK